MSSRHANNDKLVRVLGVCGGMGAGKSTLCRMLVEDLKCLAHIEADRLAHQVYQPGSVVLPQVAAAFDAPDLILEDGSLNRPALGQLVFGDPVALAKLEALVWPHVRALVQAEIARLTESYVAAAKATTNATTTTSRPVIVVEAAVLLDAGWDTLCDGVWVVRADPDVAVARLSEGRDIPVADARARHAAQASRRGLSADSLAHEVAAGVVTAVLDNSNGTTEPPQKAWPAKLRTLLDDETAWHCSHAKKDVSRKT
jgi:dephospho-CoA kinase